MTDQPTDLEPEGCAVVVPSHGITATGMIRCGFPVEREAVFRCDNDHNIGPVGVCGKHGEVLAGRVILDIPCPRCKAAGVNASVMPVAIPEAVTR